MNSTEAVRYWRESVVKDAVTPYLWSDKEAFLYLNAAYVMFCRLTGGVSDFTSEACQIEVTAGEAVADLHPSVLTIRQASLASNGRTVEVVNHTDFPKPVAGRYGQTGVALDNRPGPVRYLVIGMQRNKVRLVNVPEVDDEVNLIVYRTPLESVASPNKELTDVDEVHHVHLMDWMNHLAYLKQDADTYNPRESADAEQRFRAYCLQVTGENSRYMHKPRSVAYGGI